MSKMKDELIERGECGACRGAGKLWSDGDTVGGGAPRNRCCPAPPNGKNMTMGT